MLEASDPNNSCSRLCTCGLEQQLLWNYPGRLSRCLTVLDRVRMMSGISRLGRHLFPPTPACSWGHRFESLKKFWGFILTLFFLTSWASQEVMGLPEASTASWVQLGRVTGDLLVKPQKKEDLRGFGEQHSTSLQCKGLSCEISGN